MTGIQDKLDADIQTFLGLIAGLRQGGGDEELLALLIEQLKLRQDELNTTTTNSTKPRLQDSPLWTAETEMLIAIEMEGAPSKSRVGFDTEFAQRGGEEEAARKQKGNAISPSASRDSPLEG